MYSATVEKRLNQQEANKYSLAWELNFKIINIFLVWRIFQFSEAYITVDPYFFWLEAEQTKKLSEWNIYVG